MALDAGIARTLLLRELGRSNSHHVDLLRNLSLEARHSTSTLVNVDGAASVPTRAVFSTVSQGGQLLAVASEAGHLCLLDASQPLPATADNDSDSRRPTLQFEAHQNIIYDLTWAKSDSLILSGSADCSVVAWDASTGTSLTSLSGHTNAVKCVATASSISDVVAAGSRSGTVLLWDLRAASRQQQQTLQIAQIVGAHAQAAALAGTSGSKRPRKGAGPTPSSVTTLAFLPGGQGLVTGGAADSVVNYWDLRYLRQPAASFVPGSAGAAYHPGTPASRGGRSQAANQPCVQLLDFPCAAAAGAQPGRSSQPATAPALGIVNLSIQAQGNRLLVTRTDGRHFLYALNHPTRGPLAVFEPPEGAHAARDAHTWYVRTAFSPDGRYFASGSTDNKAFVYQVSNPAQPPLELPHDSRVGSVAWARSGPLDTVATCCDDQRVHLWSLEHVKRDKPLPAAAPLISPLPRRSSFQTPAHASAGPSRAQDTAGITATPAPASGSGVPPSSVQQTTDNRRRREGGVSPSTVAVQRAATAQVWEVAADTAVAELAWSAALAGQPAAARDTPAAMDVSSPSPRAEAAGPLESAAAGRSLAGPAPTTAGSIAVPRLRPLALQFPEPAADTDATLSNVGEQSQQQTAAGSQQQGVGENPARPVLACIASTPGGFGDNDDWESYDPENDDFDDKENQAPLEAPGGAGHGAGNVVVTSPVHPESSNAASMPTPTAMRSAAAAGLEAGARLYYTWPPQRSRLAALRPPRVVAGPVVRRLAMPGPAAAAEATPMSLLQSPRDVTQDTGASTEPAAPQALQGGPAQMTEFGWPALPAVRPGNRAVGVLAGSGEGQALAGSARSGRDAATPRSATVDGEAPRLPALLVSPRSAARRLMSPRALDVAAYAARSTMPHGAAPVDTLTSPRASLGVLQALISPLAGNSRAPTPTLLLPVQPIAPAQQAAENDENQPPRTLLDVAVGQKRARAGPWSSGAKGFASTGAISEGAGMSEGRRTHSAVSGDRAGASSRQGSGLGRLFPAVRSTGATTAAPVHAPGLAPAAPPAIPPELAMSPAAPEPQPQPHARSLALLNEQDHTAVARAAARSRAKARRAAAAQVVSATGALCVPDSQANTLALPRGLSFTMDVAVVHVSSVHAVASPTGESAGAAAAPLQSPSYSGTRAGSRREKPQAQRRVAAATMGGEHRAAGMPDLVSHGWCGARGSARPGGAAEALEEAAPAVNPAGAVVPAPVVVAAEPRAAHSTGGSSIGNSTGSADGAAAPRSGASKRMRRSLSVQLPAPVLRTAPGPSNGATGRPDDLPTCRVDGQEGVATSATPEGIVPLGPGSTGSGLQQAAAGAPAAAQRPGAFNLDPSPSPYPVTKESMVLWEADLLASAKNTPVSNGGPSDMLRALQGTRSGAAGAGPSSCPSPADAERYLMQLFESIRGQNDGAAIAAAMAAMDAARAAATAAAAGPSQQPAAGAAGAPAAIAGPLRPAASVAARTPQQALSQRALVPGSAHRALAGSDSVNKGSPGRAAVRRYNDLQHGPGHVPAPGSYEAVQKLLGTPHSRDQLFWMGGPAQPPRLTLSGNAACSGPHAGAPLLQLPHFARRAAEAPQVNENEDVPDEVTMRTAIKPPAPPSAPEAAADGADQSAHLSNPPATTGTASGPSGNRVTSNSGGAAAPTVSGRSVPRPLVPFPAPSTTTGPPPTADPAAERTPCVQPRAFPPLPMPALSGTARSSRKRRCPLLNSGMPAGGADTANSGEVDRVYRRRVLVDEENLPGDGAGGGPAHDEGEAGTAGAGGAAAAAEDEELYSPPHATPVAQLAMCTPSARQHMSPSCSQVIPGSATAASSFRPLLGGPGPRSTGKHGASPVPSILATASRPTNGGGMPTPSTAGPPGLNSARRSGLGLLGPTPLRSHTPGRPVWDPAGHTTTKPSTSSGAPNGQGLAGGFVMSQPHFGSMPVVPRFQVSRLQTASAPPSCAGAAGADPAAAPSEMRRFASEGVFACDPAPTSLNGVNNAQSPDHMTGAMQGARGAHHAGPSRLHGMGHGFERAPAFPLSVGGFPLPPPSAQWSRGHSMGQHHHRAGSMGVLQAQPSASAQKSDLHQLSAGQRGSGQPANALPARRLGSQQHPTDAGRGPPASPDSSSINTPTVSRQTGSQSTGGSGSGGARGGADDMEVDGAPHGQRPRRKRCSLKGSSSHRYLMSLAREDAPVSDGAARDDTLPSSDAQPAPSTAAAAAAPGPSSVVAGAGDASIGGPVASHSVRDAPDCGSSPGVTARSGFARLVGPETEHTEPASDVGQQDEAPESDPLPVESPTHSAAAAASQGEAAASPSQAARDAVQTESHGAQAHSMAVDDHDVAMQAEEEGDLAQPDGALPTSHVATDAEQLAAAASPTAAAAAGSSQQQLAALSAEAAAAAVAVVGKGAQDRKRESTPDAAESGQAAGAAGESDQQRTPCSGSAAARKLKRKRQSSPGACDGDAGGSSGASDAGPTPTYNNGGGSPVAKAALSAALHLHLSAAAASTGIGREAITGPQGADASGLLPGAVSSPGLEAGLEESDWLR